MESPSSIFRIGCGKYLKSAIELKSCEMAPMSPPLRPGETNMEELVRLMVGREVDTTYRTRFCYNPPAKSCLSCEGFPPGTELRNVNLSLRAGRDCRTCRTRRLRTYRTCACGIRRRFDYAGRSAFEGRAF